ncbi:MAG: hypothetical protein Kow0032_16400 [Methyloligellaceae bacterium]
MGVSAFDEAGAFGVKRDAALEGYGPQLVRLAVGGTHRSGKLRYGRLMDFRRGTLGEVTVRINPGMAATRPRRAGAAAPPGADGEAREQRGFDACPPQTYISLDEREGIAPGN